MKKLPIVRWFDDLKSALSIYIAGNVAPSGGVTAGKFYFWKGKVRLPTSNISAGETLTDSNMPSVPEGGLNKVNEKIVNLGTAVNTVTNLENTLSFSSKLYVDSKRILEKNGIVYADLRLKAVEALSSTEVLVSGFPLSYLNTMKLNAQVANGSNVPLYFSNVTTDAQIRMDYNQISVNSEFIILFSYVTQ